MPSTKKLLQAAAGSAGGDPLYVEDVFSTYLYDGNGSNRSITNGIDLAGEGGLVWAKMRSGTPSGGNNVLYDTERGAGKYLISDLTSAQSATDSVALTSFNSNGFSLGVDNASGLINYATRVYASWSFRKAEKFFDVQTWTGNGVAGRQIPHSLGSTPRFIITKRTDGADNWKCYHVGNPSPAEDHVIELDNSNAAGNESIWNDTAPTSTNFTVSAGGAINANGYTYVAYLFASDAGGFGDDGDESIIKCGSYTGNNNSNGPTVTLGFEPQWVLIKESDMSGNSWSLYDMMRDGTMGKHLRPNDSAAEDGTSNEVLPQATGFKLNTSSGRVNRGSNYIYVAIRRPMKTPESGTEVFTPKTRNGSGAIVTTGVGFTPDVFYNFDRTYGGSNGLFDRLRGRGILQTMFTSAENNTSPAIYDLVGFDTMDGVELGGAYNINMTGSGRNFVDYYFKRATGFMDVVVANASNPAVANPHNLGVVPELIIIRRTVYSGNDWSVSTNHTSTTMTSKFLNSTSVSGQGLNTAYTANYNLLGAQPTATNFTMRNQSDGPFACYLFATLAGVSKVGSYTGTGANLNVDCGFSAGARFVLITRVDATGDWYVYDSVRGIVSGNDPYVLANNSAAEVTNTDYIDPLSSGFTVTSSAPAALNASGGTYIFLAIA